MAGLFGWYGNATSADPENSHRLLAQMCRGAIFTAETNQNSAVAVTSSIGGRSILRTGDIVVAIAGLPVWNDGDLAAIAKTDGHAAALARAYRVHGLDVFQRIGGAFTLTIIDHGSGRVVAAVDRMGIGRLYYTSERLN